MSRDDIWAEASAIFENAAGELEVLQTKAARSGLYSSAELVGSLAIASREAGEEPEELAASLDTDPGFTRFGA